NKELVMKRTLMIFAVCLLCLGLADAQGIDKSKFFLGGGINVGTHEYADEMIKAINPTVGYRVNDFLSVGATFNLPIKFKESFDDALHATGGELFSYVGYSVWDGRLSFGGTLVGALYLQGYYKFDQDLDFVVYKPGTPEYEKWDKNRKPYKLNKIRWQVGVRPTAVFKFSSKSSLYVTYGFLGVRAPEKFHDISTDAAKDVKFGWDGSGPFANGLRVGVLFSPWR
ncbi:MAG: hypothetical protein Q4D93_01425, partial [Porphyromonas sp.]|nr:hypothetical protein [Porphyromonas sp.]